MRFTFADLSYQTIKQIAHLHEQGVVPAYWDAMIGSIDAREQQHLQTITNYLRNYQLNLMNEATIWSRAIYPLLLMAETKTVQAWAQVPLRATLPHVELEGIADGVIGNALSGIINAPYFIVIEAKRGLEAQNPQYQLYGSMIAAAWLNQQLLPQETQEIYGSYTIGDTWTFVHGVIAGLDTDMPTVTVQFSREYAERLEAETILHILKYIVQQAMQQHAPVLSP